MLIFLEQITFFLIILSVVFVVFEDKKIFGVIVKAGDKSLATGKQGFFTTIGGSFCDVKLIGVSGLQAIVNYNPKTEKFDVFEFGKMKGYVSNGRYCIGDRMLNFELPVNRNIFNYNYIISIFCCLFIRILLFGFPIRYSMEIRAIEVVLWLLCFFPLFVRADKDVFNQAVFALIIAINVRKVLLVFPVLGKDILFGVLISISSMILSEIIIRLLSKIPHNILNKIAVAFVILSVFLILINLLKNIQAVESIVDSAIGLSKTFKEMSFRYLIDSIKGNKDNIYLGILCLVLIVYTIFCSKYKNKFQKFLSVIAVVILPFILKTTFFIQDWERCVLIGALFGILSSNGLTHKYVECIEKQG